MQAPLVLKATLQTEKVDAAAESYFRSRSEFHRVGDESDEALKYHLLFSDLETLEAAGLEYLTDEVVLYNSYYWHLVWGKRLRVNGRYDPELEGEALNILEYATFDIDIAIVEEVRRLAEEDAL